MHAVILSSQLRLASYSYLDMKHIQAPYQAVMGSYDRQRSVAQLQLLTHVKMGCVTITIQWQRPSKVLLACSNFNLNNDQSFE